MSSRSCSLVLGVDLRPTNVVGAVLALAAPDFCTGLVNLLLFPLVTWLKAFGTSRKNS